ncbi:MAG: Xaa-Pro peptidase family protein [Deltaproteobacteria bacterium]|nr:Xaa-Pro peptidase family protein [Deltaproteobacteria bacterium]
MRHDTSPCADRVRRLRSEFPETDALLILSEKNIRYLTGFTGGEGALMAGPDWLTLLVDGRYATQARTEARGAEIVEFRNRVDGIAAEARRRGVGSAGFESPLLSVAEYLRLKEALPEAALRPLPQAFEFLRAVKDEGEIDRIREAARISREALAAVREMIRPGVREEEIALELEYRMRRDGAEQVSFETIVAAGANSALPHATPGRRAIADGDCVMIDYGAVCGGYHSDETCTFVAGRASERQREVYRHVLEAHDRAIRAIRAGVSCGEIDRMARSYLAGAGLESAFAHGTGHGVGLDVHEAPRLAAGREELLRAGMVVTVEPGVYLPGLWGIRIEDTVLVTEEGCEILTRTSKDLTVL